MQVPCLQPGEGVQLPTVASHMHTDGKQFVERRAPREAMERALAVGSFPYRVLLFLLDGMP